MHPKGCYDFFYYSHVNKTNFIYSNVWEWVYVIYDILVFISCHFGLVGNTLT